MKVTNSDLMKPPPPPPPVEKKRDKNEMFDKLLEETGGWGRYQSLLLVLFGSITSFSCAFNHLSTIYTAYTPEFSCGDDDPNSTCPPSSILTDCANFTFDAGVMRRSVVTEFRLLCDRSPLVPFINSSYMAGILIINLLAGFSSDHFGRRKVLLWACLIHVVASYLTIFATNYWFYVIVRFFVGGTMHAAWTVGFIIMNEFGIKSKRGLVALVITGGWSVGSMLMSVVAYALRDWVHMQLAFALFASTSIVFYFLVPETPRWLLLNGKYDECESVFRTLARRNGTGLDFKLSGFRDDFKAMVKCLEDERLHAPVSNKTLFGEWVASLKYPEYRKRLLLLLIPWFAVGFSNYGIHFSVSFVQYDIFTVSLVKDAVIACGVIGLTSIYDKMYRAPLLLAIYFTGGLLALSIIVIPTIHTNLRVITYLLAQGIAGSCFALTSEMTTEIVSTDARSTTFVIADGSSKVGTVIAPFVVLLGNINQDFPQVVFGIAMMVASFTFLFLQETKDQPLMQTVQDLEAEEKRTIVGYCLKGKKAEK